MRRVFDLEQQVAVRSLPCQPDRLALADALGNAHVQRFPVHADAHAAAVVDRVERHRQPGARIAPRLRSPAGLLAEAATAPEQLLEEIAEAAARAAAAGEDLLEVHAAGLALESARPGLHFVAGPVAACAQLVVGGAFFRIAQRLVGLVDGLEALLRAGLLAHVGMVLARQPAVGRLDLRVAGTGFDAEDVVVVLELHGRSACGSAPSVPVRRCPANRRGNVAVDRIPAADGTATDDARPATHAAGRAVAGKVPDAYWTVGPFSPDSGAAWSVPT